MEGGGRCGGGGGANGRCFGWKELVDLVDVVEVWVTGGGRWDCGDESK